MRTLTARQEAVLSALKTGQKFALGKRMDVKWGVVPRDAALALVKHGLAEVFTGPNCLMVKIAAVKT